MKCIRASLESGPVDALNIALAEVEKWGVKLQVRRGLEIVEHP